MKKLIRYRLISGYQDTRTNNEDFALTPYLFLVKSKGKIINAYGLGFCWGFYSVFIGLGINIPKSFPLFLNMSNQQKFSGNNHEETY